MSFDRDRVRQMPKSKVSMIAAHPSEYPLRPKILPPNYEARDNGFNYAVMLTEDSCCVCPYCGKVSKNQHECIR